MKNAVQLSHRPGSEPRTQFRSVNKFGIAKTSEVRTFVAARRKIHNRYLRASAPIQFPNENAANKSSAPSHQDALIFPIFIRQSHRVLQGCHGATFESI